MSFPAMLHSNKIVVCPRDHATTQSRNHAIPQSRNHAITPSSTCRIRHPHPHPRPTSTSTSTSDIQITIRIRHPTSASTSTSASDIHKWSPRPSPTRSGYNRGKWNRWAGRTLHARGCHHPRAGCRFGSVPGEKRLLSVKRRWQL